MRNSSLPTDDEVAGALDLTHVADKRGPRTGTARDRLAKYLDTKVEYEGLKGDFEWLMRFALETFKPGDHVRIVRVHFAGNPTHDAMVGLEGSVRRVIKSRAVVALTLDGGKAWEANPVNLLKLEAVTA